LANVEVPGAWLVVSYRNTRIVRHDTAVKTQNCLVVRPQPSNLLKYFNPIVIARSLVGNFLLVLSSVENELDKFFSIIYNLVMVRINWENRFYRFLSSLDLVNDL
jgi:nicotinamide riboside transporter PnuC